MTPLITVPRALEGFFSQLMKGNMIDDSDEIVDLPQVLQAIVHLEENDTLAGLIPQDGYKCPLTVQWELTHLCNLDCVFCYNGAERSTTSRLTIDAVMDLARQIAEMDVIEVVLSGGEILTDWDLLRMVGRYFTEHNIGMHLITNGWFTTDEHIREMKKWRVLSVQISIDGADEAAHDQLRGRSGSWRRAVKSLRMFAEAGFFTVSGCVTTRMNWHSHDDYIDLCLYLGARQLLVGDLLLLGHSPDLCRHEYLIDDEIYENCLMNTRKKSKQYRDLLDIRFAQDLGLGIACLLLKKPTALVVRCDGTTVPGCLLALPIGDVKTESLQAIWDRIRGGHLSDDAIARAVGVLQVTQTPKLGLSRTIYAPEAKEIFR